MKLSIAVLATALASASADPESAAKRWAALRRRLSFQQVAGYKPGSQVTDHCAIDLDQQHLEAQLALGTPESFENARRIYNEGGHSKSYAKVTLTTGLTADVRKGDPILGMNDKDIQVAGKAAADYERGDQVIKVYYATTDQQDTYMTCRVGALKETMTEGCFKSQGDLTIGGADHAYIYEPAQDNRADRTLAGFSEQAGDKMRLSCKGCPYTVFMHFKDYYGRDDYGHMWVESAFDGKQTMFNNGNADFSRYGLEGKEQAIKKGTAYLNVLMYVIREFEDALDDCELDSIDNNYASVHAWDEGVCFYTGSIEGIDGVTDDGKLLHQLADKRCANFKTCGEKGGATSGMAQVNHHLFDLFALGAHELEKGECSTARQLVKQITPLLWVPMIQGTLRYAYKVDVEQGGEKEQAEGATFAAAVLPKVHAVSPAAAEIIYDNMKVGASSTNFKAVKNAFESTYAGLGISCDQVGGLWFEASNGYYEGMEPCDGAAVSAQSAGGSKMELITSLCITAMAFFSL